jgi:hypothetical protein
MKRSPEFCILYSVHYLFYEPFHKKAGLFSKNLRETALYFRYNIYRQKNDYGRSNTNFERN